MLLETDRIVVAYHKVPVLKGVSLQVEEGGITALIGANGAGKSTFLRAVSGLVPLESGQIRFLGERIDKIAAHARTKMGIAHVPEGRRIFARLSVHENILIGSHTRRDAAQVKADIEQIYEQFPVLRSRQSQNGGSLSGGEQQMLAIARALMSSPKLLLMDEPSLGLSPLVVKEIARTIADLRTNRRISMVLVEQNARLALKLADRAYVFETGTVVLDGPSSTLVGNDHVRKAYLGG
jgi:branched-chain amino acid transport system ATP-binding protein